MRQEIGKDIFAGYRLVPEKAAILGCRQDGSDWVLEKDLDDALQACIRIRPDSSVLLRVMDKELEEEYIAWRVEATGPFAAKVRDACWTLLVQLRSACFREVPFVSDQANRIAARARQVLGVSPDFPFRQGKDGPGVLRHADTGKWFGLVSRIPCCKLESGAEGMTDILNLKADPARIPELTGYPGYYPAWHMNKQHWITMILDDTLDDDEIMEALVRSARLTA